MAQQDHDISRISPNASTNRRIVRGLFLVLGPVSLAGYLVVHAWLNLAGACYNLVVESSLEKLLGRPVVLPNWAVYALSPLIVVVAPGAALVQAAWGMLRGVRAGVVRIGRWQTGVESGWAAGLCGLMWSALVLWIAVACIDPDSGWRLLGRRLPGLGEYVQARHLQMSLGQLPAGMQQRRAFLRGGSPESMRVLGRLAPPGLGPEWLAHAIANDEYLLIEFPLEVQHELAGLPWYYQILSEFGPVQGRSQLLLGPLLFGLMLMIRWPGLGFLAPGGAVSLVPFLGRVVMGAGVVAASVLGNRADIAAMGGKVGLGLVGLLVVALVYWLTWKASQYWRLPRQYSPFLAMRLLQRKRIAFFSLGAVTLCVAMVLIVISVMGGFLDMVRERSHSLLGDLVMENGHISGFPFYQEFIDEIGAWPEIAAATPVIYSGGLLRLPDGITDLVKIAGIRLEQQQKVTPFGDSLFYEQWYPGTTTLGPQGQPVCGRDEQGVPVLPAELEESLRVGAKRQAPWEISQGVSPYTRMPWRLFPGPGVYASNEEDPRQPAWVGKTIPGVILGREIIAQRTATGDYRRWLQYPRGCQVTLTLLPLSRQKATIIAGGGRTVALRYVDDSRTGVYEIDSQTAYVDFELLQEQLEMGRAARPAEQGGGFHRPRASQIQVRVAPGEDLEAVRVRLLDAWSQMIGRADDDFDRQLMRTMRVLTWEEKQWDFISAVEKEKVLMLILFGVISVVAIFLILCIFYMIVLEKTRDIGILKSIGGSAGGVAGVFLSYGAAIGVVGAALGLLLGTMFVRYINEIQDWLASLHPELRVWRADVYSFETIPNTVKPGDVAVIGIVAVLAAIVGALVPAMIAARRHPVESLRYE